MNTELHQLADPREDTSALPDPVTVGPAVLRLVTGDLTSGRCTVGELSPATASNTPMLASHSGLLRGPCSRRHRSLPARR